MKQVAKILGTVGLIAVAAVAGGLLLDDCFGGEDEMSEETVEKLARLEVMKGQYEALQAALDSAQVVYREDARRSAVVIDSLKERAAEASEDAAAADSSFDVAATGLRAVLVSLRDRAPSLPFRSGIDTALTRLDTLLAEERREDRAEAREDSAQEAIEDSLRSQLREAEKLAARCSRTVEKCRTYADSLEGANESLQGDLETSFLEGFARSVPEALVKGGVTVLACTVPPSAEARVAACAGAGSIIIADLAL